MTKQARVNVRTAVNAAKIRRERRDGRDVIIVPSATMPDGVVMNKIRYPADAIGASFMTLENTPAPLGHPSVEGRFVSASSPEGMVRGFVGAWNTNVRREGGRVYIDKVIDVEFAKQLEGGRTVLNAIEKGEPIHTSTGLYCTLNEATGDDAAEWVAADIVFDHDAVLVGEVGAATPEQGVGIFVNASGQSVEVINSSLEDDAERRLDWALDEVVRASDALARVPLIERMKSAIMRAIRGDTEPEKDEEDDMSDDKMKELSGKVDALGETLKALTDLPQTITNAITEAMKPVAEQMQANAAAEKAKADAAKLAAVETVVNAGLLTKELAEAATVEVLNALADKAKAPAPAFRLNGSFKASQPDNLMPKE